MSRTVTSGPTILTNVGGTILVDRLARRIEHLGYRVHLEPLPVTAEREIFKATRAKTTRGGLFCNDHKEFHKDHRVKTRGRN